MKTILLGGVVCVLTAGWLFAAGLEETVESGKRILASEFPKTASLAMFFERTIPVKFVPVKFLIPPLTEPGSGIILGEMGMGTVPRASDARPALHSSQSDAGTRGIRFSVS